MPPLTSPLYDRTPISRINNLEERALCGKIIVRGSGQAAWVKKIEPILPVELPLTVNTHHANADQEIYCLGPTEWLIHCPLPATAPLLTALHTAAQVAIEVSDYYTVLRLDGINTATLLARACPLDLHTGVFKTGDCAQTRFGHASILLHRISETPCFDIQVRWSYAEYVWDYLATAMPKLHTHRLESDALLRGRAV